MKISIRLVVLKEPLFILLCGASRIGNHELKPKAQGWRVAALFSEQAMYDMPIVEIHRY